MLVPSYSFFWNNNQPKKISLVNSDETKLLQLLESDDVKGRGKISTTETSQTIEDLINKLELSSLSTAKPIQSPLLDGTWKLLYTSSPGTNSPIQRTFTASEKVTVFQVINLLQSKSSFLPNNQPDVSNIVCFGDSARLRVTALASTVSINTIHMAVTIYVLYFQITYDI